MNRPSVMILLIFAFVGGNLLMGIASNARSAKNSTDPRHGSIELNGRKLKVCALEQHMTYIGRSIYTARKEQYTFTIRKTRGLQNIRTDDYQPVDPSPSSKATIRPGPIEHGTPLLPYVPQYPPPPPASR